MSTQKTVSIKEMLKPGVQAVLSLWKPILLIQIFALVFVFFFYRTPELQRMPEAISHLKTQWGVGWTLLTVWTSSIAISEVAAKLTTKGRLSAMPVLLWAHRNPTRSFLRSTQYNARKRNRHRFRHQKNCRRSIHPLPLRHDATSDDIFCMARL